MTRILFVITIILFVLTIVSCGFYLYARQKNAANFYPSTQSAPKPSDKLSNLVVGKSTDKDVMTLPNITSVKKLPNDTVQYTINPGGLIRTNQVLTARGVVAYERLRVPSIPFTVGYKTISQYLQQFGPPDKIIIGSAYYGSKIATYIYSTQGFAFIANPVTDEVFELQLFAPTPIDKYISLYGQDIKETKGNGPIGE